MDHESSCSVRCVCDSSCSPTKFAVSGTVPYQLGLPNRRGGRFTLTLDGPIRSLHARSDALTLGSGTGLSIEPYNAELAAVKAELERTKRDLTTANENLTKKQAKFSKLEKQIAGAQKQCDKFTQVDYLAVTTYSSASDTYEYSETPQSFSFYDASPVTKAGIHYPHMKRGSMVVYADTIERANILKAFYHNSMKYPAIWASKGFIIQEIDAHRTQSCLDSAITQRIVARGHAACYVKPASVHDWSDPTSAAGDGSPWRDHECVAFYKEAVPRHTVRSDNVRLTSHPILHPASIPPINPIAGLWEFGTVGSYVITGPDLAVSLASKNVLDEPEVRHSKVAFGLCS